MPPYSRNLTSQVIKTPKLCWVDTGLWRQLTGNLEEVLSGQIYENYVIAEIMKLTRTLTENADLFFYRTRSGMEIDLLIETGTGVFGFEIKARDSVHRADTTALRKVVNAFGDEWRGGGVIYRGNRLHPLDKGLWAIPSWRLLS